MKFANTLYKHSLRYAGVIPVDHYVNYKHLKGIIKHDKDAFFTQWDVELNKVYEYISEQTRSEELCSCTGGHSLSCTLVFRKQHHLSTVEAEALQEYATVNREAFRKILKKYDKVYGTSELGPRLDLVDMWLKVPFSELDVLVAATLNHRHRARHPRLSPKTMLIAGAAAAVVFTFALVLDLAIKPARIETLLYVGIPCAFVLAFANGANDIANSMGTTVGAGVLTLRNAILLGSAAEFVGAITMGSFVSKSISKGLVSTEDFEDNPDLFAMGMLCVLVGAGSTTLVATMYGFPISATHGIIGGLVAIGLVAKGPEAVSWSKLGETSMGWVASPVAGMLVAFVLQLLVSTTVHNTKNPVHQSAAMQPVFMTISVGVSLLFILIKGPKQVRLEPVWLAVLVALACGAAVSFCVRVYNILRHHPDVQASDLEGGSYRSSFKASSFKSTLATSFKASSFTQLDAQMAATTSLGDISVQVETLPGKSSDQAHEDHSDSEDEADDCEAASTLDEEHPEEEKPFAILLMVSAMAVALAHGANDVGNSVGPLALILEVYKHDSLSETPEIPFWCLAMGAVGFLLGILIIGSNTISTVGTKITKLTPSRSFATQIGAAVAVLASSVVGLPVSTSHCLVGAVVGIGMAQKLSGQAASLNLKVLNRIVVGWIITIPLAMLVTCILYWILVDQF